MSAPSTTVSARSHVRRSGFRSSRRPRTSRPSRLVLNRVMASPSADAVVGPDIHGRARGGPVASVKTPGATRVGLACGRAWGNDRGLPGPEPMSARDRQKVRALGLTSATGLVIGSIVGTGVFTMPAVLAGAGTSSLLVLGVIALGAMLLATLFGQLTRRIQDSDGGLYAYARHEFGDFAGYLTGWCYWISSWAGGARLLVTADVTAGVTGADFLYTGVWLSLGEPEDQWDARIDQLLPYQVNATVMQASGNPAVKFLHCLPALHNCDTGIGQQIYDKRGLEALEVTDEVFESSASVVFDQAENRMHTIKALMLATLGPRS